MTDKLIERIQKRQTRIKSELESLLKDWKDLHSFFQVEKSEDYPDWRKDAGRIARANCIDKTFLVLNSLLALASRRVKSTKPRNSSVIAQLGKLCEIINKAKTNGSKQEQAIVKRTLEKLSGDK